MRGGGSLWTFPVRGKRNGYGNAKDFTFYFVGNYDEKTLLPLIEQYIASLPNNGFKLKNKQIPYAKGKVSNVFTKAMENPQNQATEIWYTKAQTVRFCRRFDQWI